jgi:hypothetical protein
LIETINFLDETLSHFLWFGGAAGLAITTILYQKNLSSNVRLSNGQAAILLVAGLAYGAGFSIFIIEGRAVSWALPLFGVALFLMVVALFRSNLEWRRLPTWVFFLPGFVGGLLVFLAWWIQFNGFPEPSSLLLI